MGFMFSGIIVPFDGALNLVIIINNIFLFFIISSLY